MRQPLAETSALVAAAAAGHTDVVKLLLERGANVWQATSPDSIQGAAALCAAAAAGHTDVVRLLLSHGISANVSLSLDGETFPVLHLASWAGRLEVCQLLVERGAHVNGRSRRRGGAGETALMVAVAEGHAEVARLLLERGAHCCAQLSSALHLAA